MKANKDIRPLCFKTKEKSPDSYRDDCDYRVNRILSFSNLKEN